MAAVLYLVAIMLCYSVVQFDAKCISDDYVDGCSVPLKSVFFPYAYYFEKACDKHDVCYDCGPKFGWTRYECDSTFLKNMIQLCKKNKNQEEECTIQAKKYYRAVRALGFFFFRWYSPKWCQLQECARSNGQPIKDHSS